MSTELELQYAEVFEKCQNDVFTVLRSWHIREALLPDKNHQLPLSVGCAPFFRTIYDLTGDSILLGLSRLVDKRKNSSSFRKLLSKCKSMRTCLDTKPIQESIEKIQESIEKLERATEKVRDRRNKRIAHSSISHEDSPPVPHEDVSEAIRLIKDIYDKIKEFVEVQCCPEGNASRRTIWITSKDVEDHAFKKSGWYAVFWALHKTRFYDEMCNPNKFDIEKVKEMWASKCRIMGGYKEHLKNTNDAKKKE